MELDSTIFSLWTLLFVCESGNIFQAFFKLKLNE